MDFLKPAAPPLHHLRDALQADSEQEPHEAADVGEEAARVVDDVLLDLSVVPVDVVNVEVQSVAGGDHVRNSDWAWRTAQGRPVLELGRLWFLGKCHYLGYFSE